MSTASPTDSDSCAPTLHSLLFRRRVVYRVFTVLCYNTRATTVDLLTYLHGYIACILSDLQTVRCSALLCVFLGLPRVLYCV